MTSRPDRVVVKEADDADVAAFAAFFREAWLQSGPNAPGFAGTTDEVIGELTSPEAVRERIGGPDRRMFLAWEADQVVGFAANRRLDAGSVELAGIIVLPQVVGRGVGTALVDAAVASAQREGYGRMVVRTEITNHRAHRFYRDRGFTAGGTAFAEVEGLQVEVDELVREL